MKIKATYLKAAESLQAIAKDLSDLDGDLALEVLEFEGKLETAFQAHTKRVRQLQQKVSLYSGRRRTELSEEDRKLLIDIENEIQDIYDKEKTIEQEPFGFGDGSDRDLKPYLKLKSIRSLKPFLKINSK